MDNVNGTGNSHKNPIKTKLLEIMSEIVGENYLGCGVHVKVEECTDNDIAIVMHRFMGFRYEVKAEILDNDRVHVTRSTHIHGSPRVNVYRTTNGEGIILGGKLSPEEKLDDSLSIDDEKRLKTVIATAYLKNLKFIPSC